LATATDAFSYFLNFGVGDLEGYLGSSRQQPPRRPRTPLPLLTSPPILTSEVESLNGLFASECCRAGLDPNDIIPGSGPLPFDTIDPADTNAAFDSLVFGAADASNDPGSYSVVNGALTELLNASNVVLYSLLKRW